MNFFRKLFSISASNDFEIKDGILGRYHGKGGAAVIPDGVTRIGESAFEKCSDLTSITIPESITSIGEMAFFCCDSLTDIAIPEHVTSIGRYAFYKCSSLKSIRIPDGVTSIEANIFNGCANLTSITLPESVTSIGKMAFFCCRSLTDITIPEGVTSFEEDAFFECSGLKNVTLEKYAEIYDILKIIHQKDYSAEMRKPLKYSLMFQMYMLDIDTEGISIYMQKRFKKMFPYAIDAEDTAVIQKILASGEFITKENIDDFILYAINHQKYQSQVMLTNYKAEVIGYEDTDEAIRNKFKL